MFPALFALVAVAFPTSGELVVHVVDAANQPVAGAWIACGGDGPGEEEIRLASLRGWIRDGGEGSPQPGVRWVRSAADGTARVRTRGFWNDVLAVTPTDGAHEYVATGTAKELTLALHPHRFWRIAVVDPADAKAHPHLPVMFGRLSGGHRDDTSRFETVEEYDRDGYATFGPVDLAVDPDEIDPILTATLVMPCLVSPMARASASRLPAAPTALELPPHGCYEIRLLEESGELCERRVLVNVSTNEFSQLELPGPYFGGWREHYVNEKGTVRVDPVGLGLEMRIEPEITRHEAGGGIKTKRLDESGVVEPLAFAGQARVVVLHAPPPGCERLTVAVKGRAVVRRGGPLGRHAFDVELFDPRESVTLAFCKDPVRSDDAGGFEARLDVDAPPAHAATLLLFDRGPIDSELDEDFAVAASAIGDVSEWRGGDLGEVRLEAVPLLVSGRVVGERDEPLPGLLVAMECDRKSLEDDSTVPPWWRRRFRQGGHRCDGDGRFEIHGFAGKQRWGLESWQVDGPYRVSPSEPTAAGTRDVVIHREPDDTEAYDVRNGAVAGELLLDPDVPRSVVKVDLLPPGWKRESDDDPTNDKDPHLRPWSLDDWFMESFPGDRLGNDHVPEGRWNLRIGLESLGQPFHELWRRDDVEIKAGQTLLVPPIDLRGKIKVASVELVDELNQPVPTGHVFCRERSQRPRKPGDRPLAELPDYGRFSDGRYVACAIDDWPTLEFLGHECRRVSRRFDAPGRFVVRLPPRLKIRVELPPDLRLPPAPLTLDVSFNTDEILTGVMFLHGGDPPHGDGATIDASLGADLHLPAAARYTMDVHVSHTVQSAGASSWRGSNVIPEVVIHVAEGDEGRVIRLPITQAQIDHAVKELGY